MSATELVTTPTLIACRVPQDESGQNVPGTYVFQETAATTFKPTGRVYVETTDVADSMEQFVVDGTAPIDPPAPTDPPAPPDPAISTVIHVSDPDASGNVRVSDEVIITGTVPAGSYVIDNLYYTSGSDDLTCSSAPVKSVTIKDAKSGTYDTPAETIDVTAGGSLGWVETLYDPKGKILAKGQCGQKTETAHFAVQNGGALAYTGTVIGPIIAVTVMCLVIGGWLLASRRSRNNARTR